MATRVLLLGRKAFNPDNVVESLDVAGIELELGTNIDDVHQAFDGGPVSHVIMGAGIELQTRLAIVEAIFERSNATTVHMKDFESGPAGMMPFVNGVLRGLSP